MLIINFLVFKTYFMCMLAWTECMQEVKVDASKSQVWGPGLKPDKLVFPARYFFVQLYDESGNKIRSPVKGNLEVHISGKNKLKFCKVWSNILQKNDGSYIVRYKLYNTCDNLQIDLRFDNMPIKGFPKIFDDIIYSDDCHCPQPLEDWSKHMKCEKNYSQISVDLNRFSKMKFSEIKKKIHEKFLSQGSISLCHYVVKGNELFRKCYGEYVDFKIFMDAILLSLARKIHLPDFEMFVNLGDWPLEEKSHNPLPIFSWCGSDITSDIVMPTYDLTEATLECMGRVVRDMLSVQGNTKVHWDSKINKAFWRGRDSSLERLLLIKLSQRHPDLINASLTNFFFFRDKEKEYGPKTDLVSFYDFFEYKYQINLDGTVAAYRLPFLLAGDSVVLKQKSSYFEHFYRDLIPQTHYVPFNRDLSDLIDTIKWLRKNDEIARNISQNAQRFVVENLMPKDIFCYYAILFKEWSLLLMESPKIFPDMEHIAQASPEFPCTCQRPSLKDEL